MVHVLLAYELGEVEHAYSVLNFYHETHLVGNLKLMTLSKAGRFDLALKHLGMVLRRRNPNRSQQPVLFRPVLAQLLRSVRETEGAESGNGREAAALCEMAGTREQAPEGIWQRLPPDFIEC